MQQGEFTHQSTSNLVEGRSMKLKLGRKRRELTEEETESPSISAETLAGLLDIKRHTVPEGFTEVETYPLKAPFSYASIVQSEDTGT